MHHWTVVPVPLMLMRMVRTPGWEVARFRALLDRIQSETGLSQAGLAALVPMHQSQLSRWRNGASRPTYDSLTRLGRALQERYPHLGIGPEQLVVAAGYSVEDEAPQPADHARETDPDAGAIRALEKLEKLILAQLVEVLDKKFGEHTAEVNEKLDEIKRMVGKIQKEGSS